MHHNQIRMFPFDSDELDEEELRANERVRVKWFLRLALTYLIGYSFRKCFHSPLLALNEASSLMASLCVEERTDGELSMSRMKDIASLFICGTSLRGKSFSSGSLIRDRTDILLQDSSAGPHWNHCAGALWDFPIETAPCSQRVFRQSPTSICIDGIIVAGSLYHPSVLITCLMTTYVLYRSVNEYSFRCTARIKMNCMLFRVDYVSLNYCWVASEQCVAARMVSIESPSIAH